MGCETRRPSSIPTTDAIDRRLSQPTLMHYSRDCVSGEIDSSRTQSSQPYRLKLTCLFDRLRTGVSCEKYSPEQLTAESTS